MTSFKSISCFFTLLFFAALPAVAQNQQQGPDVTFDMGNENRATVDSIKVLVDDLIRRNQLNNAHHWATRGLKLADKIDYAEGEFELSILNAHQFLNRSMTDSTIFYSERALDLSANEDQQKKAMNSLANGYSRSGQSIIAIDLYEKVLALSDSVENDMYRVGVLSNLANTHARQGNIDTSLRYYFEALEKSEDAGNDEYIAIISNNLGDKFTLQENYEQAEYYLDRSREISERIDLRSNLVRVNLNLGILYQATGRFEEAENSFQQALKMQQEAGSLPGEIQVRYNIGTMYIEKNEYTQARTYLQESLNKSREIGFRMGAYYGSKGMGQLEHKLGNYTKAIEYFAEAAELSKAFDSKEPQLDTYEELYEAHKSAGNQDQALNWLEKVNELSEEIQSTEQDQLTAQYETKFNLRQSEQEREIAELQQEQQRSQLELQQWIILFAFAGITVLLIVGAVLIRSNQKRKRANRLLVKSNRQLKQLNKTVENQKDELERLNNIKTKLFAIIAHDLRGPLSSLQSMLYLLREHELSEDETHKLITSLEKNMLENSSMMDNLLGWAKSQMNGISVNKRPFDLKHAIESVLEQFTLQAESKGVEFILELPKNSTVCADYDLLKLVLRNLIANAIKFSYANSRIHIGADHAGDSTFRVYVKDHGIGIAKENRSKIFTDDHFTSQGTNSEKGSGLGLNLCKEYIENHGESIWFETEEGEGSTFYFTIAAETREKELVST
ncbi:MAG: tetratricopeptide repeat protein [Bacteroidetes bacterium]|jgi:signal transduction histidine kinase/Flp pilus assembly protein TadD|nr:tetratricopeptide repeat protein [Bacteroidota bacterium]